MSNKAFKDLEDNAVFKINGVEFKKIPLVKVSCCRSINAQQTDNPAQKMFVQPDAQVQINDE